MASATWMRALAAAAGLLAALATAPAAAPVVTGPEARAFLGGRNGKIVYLRGFNSQVHFIDLADSVLVERKVSEDAYCLSPMIHPDGSRVLYEHNQSIWIRDLVENSPARILVYARPAFRMGQTLEPRWWMDPKDSAWHVIYNLGTIEDHSWPPASGGTWIQKLGKDYRPVGDPQLLIPFMMSAGRSRDGRWGGTSHHSTGMYKLHADRNENAYFDGTNWLDSGVVLACNASISPSRDPARQNRMMHLTSGGFTMHGAQYDNHKAVLIRTWTDASPNAPLWWMGPPGDRCNNDSSGNLFWGSPEWSTDEEYFTATGSREVLPTSPDSGDLYMARIGLSGDSRILRVLKGGSQDFYSHMWVQDGVRPARMLLDKPSLSFAAYARDSADPAPQSVGVTNAGDGVLPELRLGALPPWLKVSVIGNGTNAPRLEARAVRSGLAFGEHRAKVSVTFGAGVDSAAFEVVFRYSDPVLTSLRPFHPRPVVLPGGSILLRAEGLDQAGKPMPAQPEVAWAGLDGLQPSATGAFQADSTPWKTYRAVGRSGTVACTVHVTVARTLLRVDAGAAPGEAAPGWEPDSAYVAGGIGGSLRDSAALATVPGAAPDKARRTWRHGPSAFAFPSLPNGRYHVRLHFLGIRPGEAGGLSARFEGALLLDKYALPAAPDSQTLPAEVREVPVTVSDGDGLRIDVVSWTGALGLSALEIHDVGLPPVSLTAPNGGETFQVGDTLVIRWETDEAITSCGISVSVDSGARWLPITRLRSVGTSDPDWQAFRWVIPDSLDGQPMPGGRAMITVYDYFGSDRDRSDKAFAIQGRQVSARRAAAARAPGAAVLAGGILRIDLDGMPGAWRAELGDLSGRSLGAWTLDGARRHRLSPGPLPRGLYRLTLRGPGSGPAREAARTILLPWCP